MMEIALGARTRASGDVWHLITLVTISLVGFGLLVATALSIQDAPPAPPPTRCFATYCPDQHLATATPQP